jgi:hypothetical protein
MFKWISRLVAMGAVGVLFAVMVASPVDAHSGLVKDASLEAVKDANSQFHSVRAANAASYVPVLKCFDLPGVGGMGQHLINTSAMDDTVDALHPEAMVYQVIAKHDDSKGDDRDLRLKLVAVEYIIPFSTTWPATGQAPVLFHTAFTPITSLGLWALHAWLWKANPGGVFANYNPAVPLCPPGTT